MGPQLTNLLLSPPGRCMGREETDEVLIGDRPSDQTIACVAYHPAPWGWDLRCCRGLSGRLTCPRLPHPHRRAGGLWSELDGDGAPLDHSHYALAVPMQHEAHALDE